MSAVLNWVKSNVYTVIFVAIMIAAPIGLWIVSSRMNASVQDKVTDRSAKIAELDRLERTSVRIEIPGPGNLSISETIPVNRRFLDRYVEVVDAIRADADQIRAEVVRMNQQDRGVLLDELFPEPPMHLRETLPRQMYRSLRSAYGQLLKDVNGGSPPDASTMVEDLVAARERYMTQMVKRSPDELTEEEHTWLAEQLTKTRLSIYAERAKSISFYVTIDELNPPHELEVPPRAEGQAKSDMFDWQWQFWITQDILLALAAANEPYGSAVDAPVKRLVSLTVLDEPASAQAASASSTPRRGSKKGMGGPKGGGADPSREVPLNYEVSFTGRSDNALYDVREVELVIVAESAKLPEIFDALARQNFITVLNARLDAQDLFSPINGGYFYGTAAVSLLTLELETIWLREWTTQFMPTELKQALGIPVEPTNTG